jgi:hypothetical protein
MATVEATTQKVQRMLVDGFNNVMLTKDGFAIERGSTRVNIEVKDWGKDGKGDPSSVVRLWAFVAREVKPTPEFYRWAAVDGSKFHFGSVTVFETEGAESCTVVFDHTLLGDYIDPDELCGAVATIAGTADDLDDVVHEKFGGKRYVDQ